MSQLSKYEGLCVIDFNKILNNITENELIIDIIGYNNKKTGFNDFAVNFVSKNRSLSLGKIVFDDYYKLDKKQNINSYFFDFIYSDILKAKNVNGNLIDTYYVIPSGKSNIINFSALSIYLEEKLNKKVKIHVINSLADIPKIKNERQKKIDNLILIGDIDYNKMPNLSSILTTNQTRGIQLANSIESTSIPIWGYLPGTKLEIERIKQLGIKNKINVSVLRDVEVTEPNLKKIIIDSKLTNVIHVATHAYFFPDELKSENKNIFSNHKNPLLRSGLILSGANKNWNNNSLIDSNNDGILTAEEISFMDLSGVELIVLSACDTRLGEISNLEGVNGLQRAFKLAGANKLIMSLWKIPDRETVEFFGYFYNFLLEEKFNVNESFRKTQRIMKEKYTPYYWAGFVLLE
jgi:CHAT domain-containing protein